MKPDSFRSLRNADEVIIDINNEREYERFEGSFGTSVKVAFNTHEDQPNDHNGFILNDSLGGCGLIVLMKDIPGVNQSCWLQLDDLQSIPAKVIWVNQLDQYLFRLGIKYLI